jgi:hypothetical protein
MNKLMSLIILLLYIIVYTNDGLCQLPDGSSDSKLSVGYLNFKVTSQNVTADNKITEVTVNKSVEPVGSNLKFRYDINIPRIDDFYFVLALDSSSSLKTYPNAEQANAIINAVPLFIDDTINKYKNKNFSLSVISWDNDIDFAYSGLSNKDPKKAKVIPIQKARNELKNGVFKEIDDPKYYYRVQGEDGTNLSVALMGSIDVLKNNPVVRHHRTSKFIILVAGEGEFEKCNESLLLKEAKTEGISIYAILMNPSDKGNMLSHLKILTDNKTQSCELAKGGTLPEGELANLLETQLGLALAQAISEPAATNVTIVEPTYSYLEFGNEALIELKGKGFPIPYKVKSEIKDSSISFKIKDGLLADNITTVTFDANIGFRLPGSFNDTSPSFLNYSWLKEKDGFSISIPRNDINMVSAPLVSAPLDTASPRSGNEFGIMTLLSFLILIMIRRSRR